MMSHDVAIGFMVIPVCGAWAMIWAGIAHAMRSRIDPVDTFMIGGILSPMVFVSFLAVISLVFGK